MEFDIEFVERTLQQKMELLNRLKDDVRDCEKDIKKLKEAESRFYKEKLGRFVIETYHLANTKGWYLAKRKPDGREMSVKTKEPRLVNLFDGSTDWVKCSLDEVVEYYISGNEYSPEFKILIERSRVA